MKWGATIKDKRITMSEYNSHAFHDWAVKNEGCRVEIVPVLPESRNLRHWFHGSLVKMITFYQTGLDYRNHDDCDKVFEWLKYEFMPELVTVAGKQLKVAGSSKGQLKVLAERVLDWAGEQGYKIDVCNPDEYKWFMDEVFSNGEYDDFVSYCVAMKRLP